MSPVLSSLRTTAAHGVPRTSPGARVGALVAGAALVASTGCGMSSELRAEMPTDINVTSPMMQEAQPLPSAYTCEADGEPVSPPLSWSGLPDDVGSIALVMDDPGAAVVFWMVYDLDPQLVELRQNTVPGNAKLGQNTFGDSAYGAPCPEEGDVHEYRFTVYALDGTLDLPEGAALSLTLDGIAEQAVARGTLVTSSE
ncbi:MAG: YbhB/YbcL family Raf kinase inhibitor-like protein [Nocardiopsis sp. BM-2018]|uniref:YbhB/YbcL family Raf kinase inhibitor-like protein n=1 Tax=Nocardiopsis metallicus TaxID=179819 RepID=UPI00160B452D|nr:YbhB/YbcL family Raf kinase inhibitor-like protein [Nocardiopsis metallicus]QRN80008.1 MAG: YbhB/YbcL family Raf kinase inhibitor-like protein [Nocardiopsis sp. BM-2018]